MRINGLFLPDGSVDADQLAAGVDKEMAWDRHSNPKEPRDVLFAIHLVCQPGVCSFKFRTNIDLWYDQVQGGSATASGICAGGNVLWGPFLGGVEVCVFGHEKSTYVSMSGLFGAGTGEGVSLTSLVIKSEDIQKSICGDSYFAAGSVGPISGGGTTYAIWQWGEGHHGDQIC